MKGYKPQKRIQSELIIGLTTSFLSFGCHCSPLQFRGRTNKDPAVFQNATYAGGQKELAPTSQFHWGKPQKRVQMSP